MKDTIKKILREFDEDFLWTQENQMEVPLQDITDWCNNNETQIAEWIKNVDEFYKQSPQMQWTGDEDSDDNKMVALSVKAIGDELRNIYNSFGTIRDEINYIQNPDMYNE